MFFFRDGLRVPLPAHTKELFSQVKADLGSAESIKDLGINTDVLEDIKPFSIFGFDVYRMGWLRTAYGAIVGLPEYFASCNKQERKFTGIRVWCLTPETFTGTSSSK